MILLHTFNSRLDAEIAQNILESQNIQSMIKSDDCGGMYPQFNHVKLFINEEDKQIAEELLQQEEA
jgi:hypothetical protein